MNKIELNGKKYSFKWSFLAMREYSKLTGSGIGELASREAGADDIVNIVYCGIVAGSKIDGKPIEHTLDEVAVMIDQEVDQVGFDKFSTDIIDLVTENVKQLSGNPNGAAKPRSKKAKSGTQ